LARPIFCRSRSGSKPALAAADEVAHHLGLGDVAHAQVLAALVGQRLRRRRARFLVVVLAVDDDGVAVPGVVVHLLPDVQHAAAGRVDEDALLDLQVLQFGNADPERGHDDDIAGLDRREPLGRIARVRQDDDAHLLDAAVDVRVVDDLAREEDPLVGKLAPRLVGVIDRAIDAVAEAEFLRELDVDPGRTGLVARSLQPFDHRALIGTRQNRSDLGFQAETLLEIRLTHVP
jgi:hypothetical protein